jgi:hypothetical protein
MTNKKALEDIRGYAAARRIRVTSHGRQRMSERGVTYADVRHGLMQATACKEEGSGRWKVEAIDMSGDSLTAIILFWDGLLVVTVF